MRKFKLSARRGFSLIELVIVIMVLAIIAGMVVPLLTGMNQIPTPAGPKSEREIVTDSTMQTIRDAFMGRGAVRGLWHDIGGQIGRLPTTLGPLFLEDLPPTAEPIPVFNPVTNIGWRGPYLTKPTGVIPTTSIYGTAGDLAINDAWGNPIVLQIDLNQDGEIKPNEVAVARLVSGGPNGAIDWPLADDVSGQTEYLASYQQQLVDDIVVYLGIRQ